MTDDPMKPRNVQVQTSTWPEEKSAGEKSNKNRDSIHRVAAVYLPICSTFAAHFLCLTNASRQFFSYRRFAKSFYFSNFVSPDFYLIPATFCIFPACLTSCLRFLSFVFPRSPFVTLCISYPNRPFFTFIVTTHPKRRLFPFCRLFPDPADPPLFIAIALAVVYLLVQ